MSTPAIVLLNAAAHGGRAAALRRPMENWLAHHAPGVPLLAPGNADAALATLMIVAPRTRVVVVGGDGTVNALLPAFLRCGHRLGLVPAGRTNQLARALGIARLDWRRTLAYALRAPTAPIDIGELRSERPPCYFAAALSIGYGAVLAEQWQHAPALLAGPARQLWARSLAWRQARSVETQVWINGQLEHDGPLLLGHLVNATAADAPPHGRLDDGRLDTLLLARPRRWAWTRVLPQLIRPEPDDSLLTQPSGSAWSSGSQLVVDAKAALRLSADGERLAPLRSFRVQVLPRAVQAAGAHAALQDPPSAAPDTAQSASRPAQRDPRQAAQWPA